MIEAFNSIAWIQLCEVQVGRGRDIGLSIPLHGFAVVAGVTEVTVRNLSIPLHGFIAGLYVECGGEG